MSELREPNKLAGRLLVFRTSWDPKCFIVVPILFRKPGEVDDEENIYLGRSSCHTGEERILGFRKKDLGEQTDACST